MYKLPVRLDVLVLLISALLTGCGLGVSSQPVLPSLQHLEITPGSSNLLVAETIQLTAIGIYSDGTHVNVSDQVRWSGDPKVISFATSGRVSCSHEGSSTAVASLNDITSGVVLTCSAAKAAISPIISLSLGHGSDGLPVGFRASISAQELPVLGTSIDIAGQGKWSVRPAFLASISNRQITCNHLGSGIVVIEYQSAIAQAPLTCVDPPRTTTTHFLEQTSEFVGPFSSWVNVQSLYGAKGDGVTDDTGALQAALDNIGAPYTEHATIYLPKGTYRITKSLVVKQKEFFDIIGEDPDNTTIMWDGPTGTTMMLLDGSSWFRISRLTFDGAHRADSAEDVTRVADGWNYSTFNELSDQRIRNLTNGIKLTFAAETTINRILFERLPGVAISLGDWNTLNIFIQDSIFRECGTGISNLGGAGAFMVRNSFFDHSVGADMTIGNTGVFAARQNTSVGSGAFFVASEIGANAAQITLQGNTIIDPRNVPISIGDTGAVMLIDNLFRMATKSMPAVEGREQAPLFTDVFSMGNVYTTDVPVQATPSWSSAPNLRLVAYGDVSVDQENIGTPFIPLSVYSPPNRQRLVFEVPRGGTDQDIQRAIRLAVSSGSEKPIVHLANGHYAVFNTIHVPKGTDLQIIGDGVHSSLLAWQGGSSGMVLSLDSSRATLAEFTITSWYPGAMSGVEGIHVSVLDDPSTRIVASQLQVQSNGKSCLVIGGVEHALVELYSLYTASNGTGLTIAGGPFRQANEATPGRIDYFTGSAQSGPSGVSLDVAKGGKLLLQDNWHDAGATSPRYFALGDVASLSIQSSAVFTAATAPFVLNNFQGKIAMAGVNFNGHFQIAASSNKIDLLTLGMQSDNGAYAPVAGPSVSVGNVLNQYYDHGAIPIRPVGSAPTENWMRQMLGQIRTEYGIPFKPAKSFSENVRFERINVYNLATGMTINPDGKMGGLYYTLVRNDQSLRVNRTGDSCLSMSNSQVSDSSQQWLLLDGGEGDFIVSSGSMEGHAMSAAGNLLAVMDSDKGLDEHWRLMPTGLGDYQLVSVSSGLALTAPSNGGSCASLQGDLTSELTTWRLVAH